MRTAVVQDDGTVVNVIEAGEGFAIPGMRLIASATAAIGDLFANGAFTRPAPEPAPVPEEVTDLQARLALSAAGLLAAVDNAVAGSSEAVRVWYDRALTWRRDSEHIAALAPSLGLTDEQIDLLFRDAARR